MDKQGLQSSHWPQISGPNENTNKMYEIEKGDAGSRQWGRVLLRFDFRLKIEKEREPRR